MARLPNGIITTLVVGIGVCVVASMLGIFIEKQCLSAETPCMCLSNDSMCTLSTDSDDTRCKIISYYMKVPLIATHLAVFVLMPISMWVTQKKASTLTTLGAKSPEQIVQGLAYLMVSVAGEVGWHVHQRWFYHDDFDILNCFFYVFNTLGATFWALGTTTDATESSLADGLLMICPPLAMLVYGYAAYAEVNGLFGATKFPIYIIMCYQYFLLAWRLFKLLKDNLQVTLFPFFSVGVNLFFIYLLSKYEQHIILNPLFHILHDALGTELGVFLITIIVWGTTADTSQDKKVS